MTDLDRELEVMAEAIAEARRASTGRAAGPPAGRARRAGRLAGWALAFGVGVGSGVWVAARGLEPPLAGPHDTRVEGRLVRGSLRHDERAGEVRFSMLVNGAELPVRYAMPFVPDFLEVAFDMLEERPDVSGLGQAMVVGEALPGGDFAARHVRAGPGCTLGYWEGGAERRVRRMQRVSRDAASTGEVVIDVGAELERAHSARRGLAERALGDADGAGERANEAGEDATVVGDEGIGGARAEPREIARGVGEQRHALGEPAVAESDERVIAGGLGGVAQELHEIDAVSQAQQGAAVRFLGREKEVERLVAGL
jgi:hypothetical protein